MVIMSIDYGDSRTGISACDKNEILASPVCVINEKYFPKLFDKTISVIEEKKPEIIVMGYPKNMDGTCGERCEKCKDFADKITAETGIQTVLWDERLTTVSAYKSLHEADFHGKKTRKVIDAVAAVTILQSYIDYRKNNTNHI